MKKSDAIRVIYQAAKIYSEQLCNKKLLIIYGAPNKPNYVETVATPSNFLHLTGVKLNGVSSAGRFYRDACDRKLKESDFEFKDGTTEQKLNVLVQTLRVASNAKMIGDYNYNSGHIKLQTDKLAGSVYSCLGFEKVDGYFIPNTVLAADIRNEVYGAERVLAVLSRKITEKEYNKIEKVAKKIDIEQLLQKLKKDVSISPELTNQTLKYDTSPPDVNRFSFTPNPLPSPAGITGGAAVLAPPRVTFGQAVGEFRDRVKNFFADKASKRRQRIDEQRAAIAEKKKDELTAILNTVPEENAKLLAELDSAREENSGLKKEISKLSDALNAAREEISNLKKEVSKLSNALNTARGEVSKLSDEINAKREEILKLSDALNAAREKNSRLSVTLNAKLRELSETKDKLRNSEVMTDKLSAIIREINEILVRNPLLKSDYLKAKREYREKNIFPDSDNPPNRKNPPKPPKHKR